MDVVRSQKTTTTQEEETSNSDGDDKVEANRQSCEAGQDNRPEIQDAGDKVKVDVLFVPAFKSLYWLFWVSS